VPAVSHPPAPTGTVKRAPAPPAKKKSDYSEFGERR
jgi:hypothetical protein